MRANQFALEMWLIRRQVLKVKLEMMSPWVNKCSGFKENLENWMQ